MHTLHILYSTWTTVTLKSSHPCCLVSESPHPQTCSLPRPNLRYSLAIGHKPRLVKVTTPLQSFKRFDWPRSTAPPFGFWQKLTAIINSEFCFPWLSFHQEKNEWTDRDNLTVLFSGINRLELECRHGDHVSIFSNREKTEGQRKRNCLTLCCCYQLSAMTGTCAFILTVAVSFLQYFNKLWCMQLCMAKKMSFSLIFKHLFIKQLRNYLYLSIYLSTNCHQFATTCLLTRLLG